MGSNEKRLLMDAAGLKAAIGKLADSVLARERRADDLAIVGIRRRGVPIAQRLVKEIETRAGVRPLSGVLDITLYRDDLSLISPQPVVSGTDVPFDVAGKRIVLVDDVLFTGRTVRAAVDEVIDFGRPRRIELAVLVDRGWRELPVAADHAALTIETTLREVVKVHLLEVDGDDFVEIVTMPEDVK